MVSGIYRITNTVNGKYYIGSSKDIEKRLKQHQTRLANDRHENKHLQASYNIHGIDGFRFEVVSEVPVEDLQKVEQGILDSSDWSMLYNISRCTEAPMRGFKVPKGMHWGMSGKCHNLESREKISKALVGKKHSEQHRINSSLSRLGKPSKRPKSYEAKSPDGFTYSFTNLTYFCKDNNLNVSHMSSVANGKLKHHKGWLCWHKPSD